MIAAARVGHIDGFRIILNRFDVALDKKVKYRIMRGKARMHQEIEISILFSPFLNQSIFPFQTRAADRRRHGALADGRRREREQRRYGGGGGRVR